MTIVKCIHNILHNRGLLSRRWSITPYPLSVGCTQWLPPKGYSMEKGGQLMEKPHKHNLSQRQMIKVNINSDKSWQYYIPSIWYTENGTFTSMVFFPKIYNSISSHRKKNQTNSNGGRGTFYKISDEYSSKYQICQKQTTSILETVTDNRNLRSLDK